MTTYALKRNGKISEVFSPVKDDSGNEISIDQRFHPDIVSQMIEVPDGTQVELDQVEDIPLVTEISARSERDRLLQASDWTQLRDVPDEVANAWADYRQELRMVPEQVGFPESIVWPDVPTI